VFSKCLTNFNVEYLYFNVVVPSFFARSLSSIFWILISIGTTALVETIEPT